MPTIQQLEQALIAADKAGDTAAASTLAQALKQARREPSVLDYGARLLGIPMAKGAPEAVARGAGDAATLGFIDEGGAALGIDPFKGDWGGQYEAGLGKIRAEQEASQREHPLAFGGGQVAGAVAQTALVPWAAPVRGATLLENAVRLAPTGAALGSVYGFGSGKDMNSRLWGAGQGAGLGFATGAASPYVGRAIGIGGQAIGTGTRAVVNALTGRGGAGAERSAAGLLARPMAADNLADAIAMQRQLERLGPQGMMADLGPNLQTEAGRIARLPNSQAQTVLRDALETRQQGAPARIKGEVDEALGPSPEPHEVTGTFSDKTRVPQEVRNPAQPSIRDAREAVGAQYEPLLQNSAVRAVDTRAIANNVEAQIANQANDTPAQAALQQVRRQLNVAGTNELDPLPLKLHRVRVAIDDKIRAADTPDAVKAVLQPVRQAIDEELRLKVPGIKELDARYRELATQLEAFNVGRSLLGRGPEVPPPRELATRMGMMTEPRQSAGVAATVQGPPAPGVTVNPLGQLQGPPAAPFRVSQGLRTEIDRVVGNTTNDLAELNRMIKGEGSWNRDRLAQVLGEDRADTIINLVERERRMAGTHSVVLRNSETARREMADAAAGQAAREPGVIHSALDLRLGSAVTRAIDNVSRSLRATMHGRRDVAAARLLTSQGPEAVRAVQTVADAIQRRNRQLSGEESINFAITAIARGLGAPMAPEAVRRITDAMPHPSAAIR